MMARARMRVRLGSLDSTRQLRYSRRRTPYSAYTEKGPNVPLAFIGTSIAISSIEVKFGMIHDSSDSMGWLSRNDIFKCTQYFRFDGRKLSVRPGVSVSMKPVRYLLRLQYRNFDVRETGLALCSLVPGTAVSSADLDLEFYNQPNVLSEPYTGARHSRRDNGACLCFTIDVRRTASVQRQTGPTTVYLPVGLEGAVDGKDIDVMAAHLQNNLEIEWSNHPWW
ncbi:uncharacterized protein EDB93DRAFT_1334446 [Suillus bovinus]|uniref:uncharacterized protein n=1 Tax=Suillus bovinus TaxID=48563 RepID=UPI001B879BF7|nr:uncharacterized protein EDB93DRAFT_1334446 [Suillus bovinus]KAG2159105.1 hypothetical protein EDB93DRAFT_1334446 [Suillus bovinus]